MDKDLYKIMAELSAQKSNDNTIDVKYMGTVSISETGKAGQVQASKDIIAMIDIEPDGAAFIKYFDENQSLIAVRGSDGELMPSAAYRYEDLSFLSEIDQTVEEQGISFKEVNENLERVSRALGIDKSDIISMSEAELNAVIEEKGDYGLILDNKNQDLTQSDKLEHNNAVLDSVQGKQEVDLDNKVDNKYTLAQILNVPAGSKLVIVDSDKIQGNDITTRFSCVIRTPDEEIIPADMLEQVGGKSSDKNAHEVDRTGKVEKQNVQSSFKINSSYIDNAVITVRKGSMGTTKVAYGLTDPTSHRDVFSQDLETNETYPVSAKVRDEFSQKHGIYNVSEKMDEIENHVSHGERKLSLEEVAGRSNTGHIHGEEAAKIILADDDFVQKTNDIFSSNEIANRFESMREKYPNLDRNELIEITKQDLEYDAEYMPTHERNSR